METSSLGRPLEGLDPGGVSSAPGCPGRKGLTPESCIRKAKVRGGHSHAQLLTPQPSIRGPPVLPPGPSFSLRVSRPQHPESTLSEYAPTSEDCPFPGPRQGCTLASGMG